MTNKTTNRFSSQLQERAVRKATPALFAAITRIEDDPESGLPCLLGLGEVAGFLIAQCVYEQSKRRRKLATARVVEMVAREGRAPVAEHADQPSVGDTILDLLFEHESEALPAQGRLDRQAGKIEGQRTLDAHAKFAPALLEFPGVKSAIGRQAKIDAGVPGQVLRRPRRRMLSKIGRRAD